MLQFKMKYVKTLPTIQSYAKNPNYIISYLHDLIISRVTRLICPIIYTLLLFRSLKLSFISSFLCRSTWSIPPVFRGVRVVHLLLFFFVLVIPVLRCVISLSGVCP